jgi:uncharacterized protein (DUF2141 family)
MKEYLIIIGLSILQFSNAQDMKSREGAGDLTITISGLKNNRGNVKIGLFNSVASWKDKEAKFMGAIIGIENAKSTWVIRGVPYGYYAIKFFHDENNNDKINMRFGMPTETYGFYKKGNNRFIPPSFEKAKFRFESEQMSIHIIN